MALLPHPLQPRDERAQDAPRFGHRDLGVPRQRQRLRHDCDRVGTLAQGALQSVRGERTQLVNRERARNAEPLQQRLRGIAPALGRFRKGVEIEPIGGFNPEDGPLGQDRRRRQIHGEGPHVGVAAQQDRRSF